MLDAARRLASLEAMSYRHIVIFKFKDSAPADKVRGVVEAFKALPSKLPAYPCHPSAARFRCT
jgi:hypothetical protein